MEVLELTPAVAAARAKWRFRGATRPDFALPTRGAEESVWDYPRPPRLETVIGRLRVKHGELLVADTERAARVLETAGAPTYYFPPEDVRLEHLVVQENARSACEWKGVAQNLSVAGVPDAAWSYLSTYPEFAAIRGWFAFFPAKVDCYVGEERGIPQPGGYYGGWITRDLRGPFKGEPGTEHW